MMKLTLTRTICAGSLALSLSGATLLAGARPPAERPDPVAEEKADALKGAASDAATTPMGTAPLEHTPAPLDAGQPGHIADPSDAMKPDAGAPQPFDAMTPEHATPPKPADEAIKPDLNGAKPDGDKATDKALDKGAKAGDDAKGEPLAHQDVQTLQELSEHHMGNLVLGLITIERADSDELQKHGHKLVDESAKRSQALMELAREKGIFIAVDQLKLPTEELTSLSEKQGKEFDSAVLISLLDHGSKLQAHLQQSVGALSDPEVRKEAEGWLSKLGDGLTKARDLANSIGVQAPMPVGEAPLPEKDSSPAPTPQDQPPKGGEEGGAIRPFDNPPGF